MDAVPSRSALQSMFWRNDAVPWMAFLRVLDSLREDAGGTLNQQITPYSYVGQEVSAKGTEQISVPAGSFSVLKVIAQVDIATIMPNWPRFVLHVIKPFVTKVTLYFDPRQLDLPVVAVLTADP